MRASSAESLATPGLAPKDSEFMGLAFAGWGNALPLLSKPTLPAYGKVLRIFLTA